MPSWCRSIALFLLYALVSTPLTSAIAAAPRVAVTIKPIHALAAGVMGRIGAPQLVLQGSSSPHSTALRPSQMRLLENADIIFYIADHFETALKPVLHRRRQAGATVVELSDTPNLTLHQFRSAGIWSTDDQTSQTEHDRDDTVDPHIWLDPQNAKAITLHISAVLARIDPGNADAYRTNAAKLMIELNALGREVAAKLQPVANQPFVVFHDAYQYFERRFGLSGLGAITADPGHAPGAKRLIQIRTGLSRRGAVCVFAEPQFEIDYVTTVIEGSRARAAILDPLGIDTPVGKEAYASLIWSMTNSITRCLSNNSLD